MVVLLWIFVAVCTLLKVTKCQDTLQISPVPWAFVKEKESLTLTCYYTGPRKVSNFTWQQNNDTAYTFVASSCSPSTIQPHPAVYQYNCSITRSEFSWTILYVPNQRHGEQWSCGLDVFPYDSLETSIFVIVPVRFVHFSSPAENRIYVIEYDATQFMCTTSVERPRSTIQWFVGSRSLAGGYTEPTNNDTLASTNGTFSYSFNRVQTGSQLYCTAFNIDVNDLVVSNNKELIVEFPPDTPTLKVGTQHVFGHLAVVKGDNVIVTCESTSKPGPPTYQWTGQAAGNSTLTINNINSTVTKTCTARNTMSPTVGSPRQGLETASLNVTVMIPPDTPTFKVGTVSVSEHLAVIKGDNVTVTCESTSDPGPPTYQWTGQSAGFRTLTINNIQLPVTKSCTARNIMNTTVGSSVDGLATTSLNITVMSGPTIPGLTYISQTGSNVQLSAGKLVVIKGTVFSVKCSGSTSVPDPPSYSWSGRVTSANDTIFFTDLDSDVSDNYTCLVENTMVRTVGTNQIGRNSKRLDVEVQYPPIISPLQNQTIVENGRLSLLCSARSNPLPTSYSWTRSMDSFNQHSSTLTIDRTQREDTDTYTCTARNQLHPTIAGETDGVDRTTINVKVLYPPDVTLSHINGTDTTEGDVNVMIRCYAKGEPPNYAFARWTHFAPDGYTKIQEHTSSLTDHDKAYLRFPNTSYMDSGVYKCGVTNGIAYRTSNTTLVVRGRPVIIQSDSIVVAASHQNASLSVTYYSNDGTNPTVKWYRKDGETRQEINAQGHKIFFENVAYYVRVTYYSVRITQSGYRTQLFMQDVSGRDFGDYEAEIANSIDKVVLTTRFIARGAPDPPMMFSAVPDSATSSSVVLIWVSGFHGGADQTFTIQYNTPTTPWQSKTSIITIQGGTLQNTSFNATVDQLSAETQYFFRIFATNKYGRSDFTFLKATTRSTISVTEPASNAGAAAGGAVAGVIVAVIIILVVLFFLRRHKRFPFCKNKQKSDDVQDRTHEHEYVNMNAHTQKTAKTEQLTEEIRQGSALNESLNSQGQSSSPYEILNTEQQGAAQRSVDHAYADLDSKKTTEHLYANTQAAFQQKASNTGKPRIKPKPRVYANVRGVQQKAVNTKPSKEDVHKESATPEVTYSNLKMSNA